MNIDGPMLGAFLVALCRATGLAATAPVIGDAGVPMRAKAIFVVVCSMAVAANRGGVDIANIGIQAPLELAVGILTGLSARFVMARVAVAGQLIGISLGLSFASQYDSHAGESATTVRTFLTTIASLAFLAAGGLEAIVRGIAAPVSIFDLAVLGPQLVAQACSAMGAGLQLAAPLVLAALVANIGLAIVNRAAPAVNVFAISMGVVLLCAGSVIGAGGNGIFGGVADIAHDAANMFVH